MMNQRIVGIEIDTEISNDVIGKVFDLGVDIFSLSGRTARVCVSIEKANELLDILPHENIEDALIHNQYQ